MWTNLDLTMKFTVPLCGGVPRNDDIVKKWVELRKATETEHAKMDGAQTLDQVATERVATTDPLDVDDEMSKVWVGFSRNAEGNLFVRGGALRAHLKDAAQVLGRVFKLGNVSGMSTLKVFAAKLKDSLYVKEDQIVLLNGDGTTVTEATGFRDATMSVMTAQGPRTCLKRVDFVSPCSMTATLQLLEGGEIKQAHIEKCLEYGAVHGFGQDRSLQYGRYDWTLTEKD